MLEDTATKLELPAAQVKRAFAIFCQMIVFKQASTAFYGRPFLLNMLGNLKSFNKLPKKEVIKLSEQVLFFPDDYERPVESNIPTVTREEMEKKFEELRKDIIKAVGIPENMLKTPDELVIPTRIFIDSLGVKKNER